MPPTFRGSSRTHRLSSSNSTHPVSSRQSPLKYSSSTFLSTSRTVHLAQLPQVRAEHSGRARHYDHDQHAGAEPGVNPRSGESIAEYSHFKQDCVIDVVEYDSEDVTFQRFTNAGLINFLNKGDIHGARDDGDMPPRMVRWINIGGIDWSVLSAVALRYNLHSLSLEDILHERGHTHSKADYYPGHVFLRVLCHTLSIPRRDAKVASDMLDGLPQFNKDDPAQTQDVSCEVFDDPDQRKLDVEAGGMDTSLDLSTLHILPDKASEDAGVSLSPRVGPQTKTVTGKGKAAVHNLLPFSLRKRLTGLSGFGGPSREEKKRQIKALTTGDHSAILGTVISIHPTVNLQYTSPIAERIHRADSVLRTSEDASLLVESLLDLVVDRVLEIVDEYQVKIDKLEHDILLNPVMRSVRSPDDYSTVHILSGDLILHKRTLEPIRTMVYGLRRYDLERSRALADNIALEIGSSSDTDSTKDKIGGKQNGDKTKRSAARSQAQKRKRRLKQLFEAEHFARHDDSHLNEGESNTSVASRVEHPTDHRYSTGQERINRAKQGALNVQGYFSYKAKVYLTNFEVVLLMHGQADVSDHMDFALTSLDMFAGISENLINYAFNVASYEMNIVMNRLTLATIIFLPLTLLTGYFGMNFAHFWSVEDHSDTL
ncbi:hypothetical protein CVT25_015598 [Psilocybe cyanescens]|uniref:Magnesium transporter n=1 Tax=Psilocybe cyanescens TaxID=93625 RepID=A0A409WHR8_PSICY|nr:hypothetical protein CVT25_015598 [Psilocybe cyanescens]